ncbi:hypothetical protein SELMODRAFT_406620 [Selaginella moellendorffii]|uniref:Uncharacterized protein n=1 Tax=Selaginella moellendorffii TaxID=88036 RepID=D8R0X8_SELML|nr:hypothetical protein SELMODRAFT_406620 [Selaginella moellendorffii]
MWMLSQIDFDTTVIEAIGIDTAEATAIGGGVLVFDAGGGGGVVPLAAKAARGNIDKPTKEVIGSVVVESTAEATKAVDTIIQAQEWTINKVLQEMAWNGPHCFLVPLCRLVQSYWVRSSYNLNMALYSLFVEVRFGSTAGFIGKLFWVINGNHRWLAFWKCIQEKFRDDTE